MKKIILLLLIAFTFNTSKAQNSYQNIQDVINVCSQITGSDIEMNYLDTLQQTKINGTLDVVNAGHKGLFFLRIRATNFIGTIDFYLNDSPVLQLTSNRSIDTGNIYVICTSYDAIGISDDSGTVTIEGFAYSPNPPVTE